MFVLKNGNKFLEVLGDGSEGLSDTIGTLFATKEQAEEAKAEHDPYVGPLVIEEVLTIKRF